MRIGIREQLGLLVLITTLIALAVVAIATVRLRGSLLMTIPVPYCRLTDYDLGGEQFKFRSQCPVGLRSVCERPRADCAVTRSSGLSLTAYLYANQLSSILLLLESNSQTLSTRVLLQNALQRYNQGNNTDANWSRAASDLSNTMQGSGDSAMLLQAQVFSKNGSGIGGRYGILNVTSPNAYDILLPPQGSDGSTVPLGQNGSGYPETLYPNLTFTTTPINSTFNVSNATYNGLPIRSDSTLLLGPWLLNASFGLMSITLPVVNTTAPLDTLGWMTLIYNAKSIMDIETSVQGLGQTGEILLFAPKTTNQKFSSSLRDPESGDLNRSAAADQEVTFVLPPVQNGSRSTRHTREGFGTPATTLQMRQYPAVLDAYTSTDRSPANGGSIISTTNEGGTRVSVGYSRAASRLVDWALIVEESYDEVTAPIRRLRDILVACVFATVGALLICLFPIAHLFVRPIRRLREATKKTVEPEPWPSEYGSERSSHSAGEEEEGRESINSQELGEIERKEGFIDRVTNWRSGRTRKSQKRRGSDRDQSFRIPGKVEDPKHVVQDELTDLTRTFNEMSEELTKQYQRLEEKVRERTAELEVSKRAAESANEAKTLFIANISHELKTPLNGILGMCAVCMQEEDPMKLKRSLGIIYKSGDLLLHLLTDLLTFTKNEIGQQLSLEEKEFRLGDVCSQILSIFENQARDSRIKLGIIYQGPQEGTEAKVDQPNSNGYGPSGTGRIKDMCLWGDQHRILQVIINLVNNSLKFTPKDGSVQVSIRCLGDAPEKVESRKGSIHSKQSKRHSSKGSRHKASRAPSGTGSVVSVTHRGRDTAKNSGTAVHLTSTDGKNLPPVSRERSSTPPPINARRLMFEFEVEDTGPGIPDDQQAKVFEPFMQGDLGLSKKYGGTGLGLSICSQLARLMDGDLRLQSHIGAGSKFTMRIPLIFVKEKADSMVSSNLNSRRNSANLSIGGEGNQSPSRRHSSSDLSVHSDTSVPPAINGLDAPVKPRLVGLSQPFFAVPSPLESPDKQLAAIEQVAAQAAQSGDKVRVLVAEDNSVNQEVVLRMLKLEDIYGMVSEAFLVDKTNAV